MQPAEAILIGIPKVILYWAHESLLAAWNRLSEVQRATVCTPANIFISFDRDFHANCVIHRLLLCAERATFLRLVRLGTALAVTKRGDRSLFVQLFLVVRGVEMVLRVRIFLLRGKVKRSGTFSNVSNLLLISVSHTRWLPV